MPRPRILGQHYAEWDIPGRTIKIYPRYPGAGDITDWFGLGNATIKISLKHPPTKIIKQFSGETDKSALAPTSPYKLKRWIAMPSGIQHKGPTTIVGYNNEPVQFEWDEASSFEIKEASDTDIVFVGLNSVTIGGGRMDDDAWFNYGVSVGLPGFTTNGSRVVGLHLYNIDYAVVLSGGNLSVYNEAAASASNKYGIHQNSNIDIMGTISSAGIDTSKEKIVDIAGGGETLRIRFDSGRAATLSGVGLKSAWISDNVAFITKHKEYKFKMKYYKTGPGADELCPLIEDDIVAVFEGYDKDHIIRLQDVPASDKVTGWFNGAPVLNGNSVMVGGQRINVDSYGSLKHKRRLIMSCNIWTAKDASTDYLWSAYQDNLAITNTPGWSTMGLKPGVGSVVGGPERAVHIINAVHRSSDVGVQYDFYVASGKVYDANGNRINIVTLEGQSLMDFAFSHNMANYFVDKESLAGEIESSASIGGFKPKYKGKHWVDANLQAL